MDAVAKKTEQPGLAEYKTPLSTYETGNYTGENQSGWAPVGDSVLILPDTPMKKIGNILVPEVSREKQAWAAESGLLIALGGDAFVYNSDRTRKLEATEKPKSGDRVIFNRYSGIRVNGDDGQEYHIMVDHSIRASRRA